LVVIKFICRETHFATNRHRNIGLFIFGKIGEKPVSMIPIKTDLGNKEKALTIIFGLKRTISTLH
jgi:hypothetical protein